MQKFEYDEKGPSWADERAEPSKRPEARIVPESAIDFPTFESQNPRKVRVRDFSARPTSSRSSFPFFHLRDTKA
jgi:hypothetical protein